MDDAVDSLLRRSSSRGDLVGLAGGLPDASLFPRDGLRTAFARAVAAGDDGGALQYDWPEGVEPLREWIARRLASRGIDVQATDVIVTNGAQQALSIAASVLARPGDAVETDALSYPAALDLFRGMDLRPVAEGTAAAAFAYVMPGVSNPLGVGLTTARREALARASIPLLVDEAYAELRFDGVVPPALAASHRERTWLAGSFSKTLCPGLRVGFLVPPRAQLGAALTAKQDLDLQAGTLSQTLLAHFLAKDDFEGRLARARRVYEARAERLLEALDRHLPGMARSRPEGGFSVWLESDAPGDDVALLETAIEHGVSFDPGHRFARDDAPRPLSLRVCFSSAPVERLALGVERLARALDACRRGERRSARRTA